VTAVQSADRPVIAITVAVPSASSESDIAERKNNLYADAVERWGGDPLLIDATSDDTTRRSAWSAMSGLLLSGGADIDPARYGQPVDGARDIDEGRDELEAEAWAAAAERDLPVLGICRGLQAVNVFAGGTLTQHVDGHAGAPYGHGTPDRHPLRLVPGTRLGGLLQAAGFDGAELVNTFHHQAVRAEDLAPSLVAAGWSDSSAGPLVEALESRDDRWVRAVQSHPEREDSTPPAFERLFADFIAAAGHVGRRAPVAAGQRSR
jgi:putative glutamine amidotransferase